MKVLVTYASKYGGTRGSAERIAQALNAAGLEAVARPVTGAGDLGGFDAVVLGSAVYMGLWMKDAIAFARRNRNTLASRPLWLFSSGPLGVVAPDREAPEPVSPKQIEALRETLGGFREHRIFFGVSDHTHFDLRDKLIYAVPAGKKLLADGDFREWPEIEAWAKEIAHALEPVRA